MKTKRKGSFFLMAGALLLAASLCLTGYNLWEERHAADVSDAVLQELSGMIQPVPVTASIPSLPETQIPDYILNPDMEMPVVEVDGHKYIGYLEFPTLDLAFPVMSSWSYPNLKLSPCRYTGSAYTNDLVIAAHNYERHFGRIKTFEIGDPVYFTDVDGNQFHYAVVEVGQLDPIPAEAMLEGDWDLSLFTCTLGGQYRVTIRCVRDEST